MGSAGTSSGGRPSLPDAPALVRPENIADWDPVAVASTIVVDAFHSTMKSNQRLIPPYLRDGERDLGGRGISDNLLHLPNRRHNARGPRHSPALAQRSRHVPLPAG